MVDEIDQSQTESGITSEEPEAANSTPSLDLDKFREELLGSLNSSFDERFKGFQKTLSKRDEKITQLEQRVLEANRADLTEGERTALDVQEKDEQIARLQMALELKELASEFPAVAPVFSDILEADSPRAQMEILARVLSPKEQVVAQEQLSSQAQEPSVVDQNNPPETGVDGMSYEDAFEKDPSLLDRILKGSARLRGADE